MKVTSPLSPSVARDTKPAGARHIASIDPSAGKIDERALTRTTGAERIPPGLERVRARLESLPADGRNDGLANALRSIELNIARYQERHGITANPGDSPAPPPSSAPASGDTAVAGTPTSDSTTAAPPSEPPAATAAAIAAPAGSLVDVQA